MPDRSQLFTHAMFDVVVDNEIQLFYGEAVVFGYGLVNFVDYAFYLSYFYIADVDRQTEIYK